MINSINGGNYRIGDQVTIIFDPNNPTHAEIKDSGSLSFTLFWTSLATIGTIAFFAAYRLVKKSEDSPDSDSLENTMDEDFKFCVHCGEKMSKGDRYCCKCGKKQS